MTNNESESSQDPSTTDQPTSRDAERTPDRFDPRRYTDPGRDELGDLLRASLIGDLSLSYELPQEARFPHYDWRQRSEVRPDLPTGHGAFQHLIDCLSPDSGKPIVIDPELLQQALSNTDPLTLARSKRTSLNAIDRTLSTTPNPAWQVLRTRLDRFLLSKHLSPVYPLEPDPEEHP